MPSDIPNLVKSEQVGCARIAKHPAAVGWRFAGRWRAALRGFWCTAERSSQLSWR